MDALKQENARLKRKVKVEERRRRLLRTLSQHIRLCCINAQSRRMREKVVIRPKEKPTPP